MKNTILPGTALLMSLLLVACQGEYRKVTVTFEHQGNQLSATLVLPNNSAGPFPVSVFVHGDGALPYDDHGYYRALWNTLAYRGIASFSWDKPGVGASQGDWESQSMDDRSEEVIAAIEAIKRHPEVDADNIGLIGYSQAGWVMPRVAEKSDSVKFMVMVSGAVNWMDQGAYLTKTRLTQGKFSAEQIEQGVKDFYDMTQRFISSSSTYEEYLKFYNSNAVHRKFNETPMTPQRFRFAKLNWHYDARTSLKAIRSPTLAIFGGHDLNVNVAESERVYLDSFEHSGNQGLTVKHFSDGQHGLLKQEYFVDADYDVGSVIKLEFLGEDAFAHGYLDYVVNWVSGNTSQNHIQSHISEPEVSKTGQ